MRSRTFLLPFFISVAMHAVAISACLMHGKVMDYREREMSVLVVDLAPPGTDRALGTDFDASGPEQLSRGLRMIQKGRQLDARPCHDLRQQDSIKVIKQDENTPEVHQQQEITGSGGGENDAEEHGAGATHADLGGNGGVDGGRGISSPAVIAKLSKPEYPRYSRIHGEEGKVELAVKIEADGRPGRVDVIRSSGHPRLDDAARRALEKAVFVPAREHGEAVASTKRIAFRFNLEEWGK
jgi:protein TonB